MRTIFHPFGFCGGADNENLPFPASGSPSARFPQERKCRRFFCESKKIRPFRCLLQRKKPPEVYLREALSLERATRIGLATEAWEAPILPLNYARV